MRRIGILGHTFVNWGGGLDFLRMVAASLQASGEPLELHLLLPVDGPLLRTRTALRAFRDRLTRATPAALPSRTTIDAAVTSIGAGVTPHEIDIGRQALRRSFRRLGLDVLVPAIKPLSLDADMPWVGYVYDFQHRHLPQLFRPRSAARRDRAFAEMLQRAPSVIVNARAVESDIRRFIPGARSQVFALPFSAEPNPAWLELPPPPLQKLGVDGPYFIVCNQFWQHKDHLTAFRAFAQAAAAHPTLHLVCTGETGDFRNNRYFADVMEQVRALGVEQRVHVLGLIPKHEQIALLRHAVALVQPTLSEGGPGGGAGFDAVSLGVPAILSDIPVNREIEEPGVSFFRAGDPASLAAQMHAALQAHPVDRPLPAVLLERGHARRARCGQVLLQALDAARHNAK